MFDAPMELLLAIVEWVEDTSVLFNLRLVSHTFNAVAAPLVLRVIVVKDSVRSAEGLACLQAGGETTRNAVQQIIFEGDPERNQAKRDRDGRLVWRGDDISGSAGRDALCIAFSGLKKFYNLKVLRLEFHRPPDIYMEPDNPSHFMLLQLELFAVLAGHPPPPLVSLTLCNIIPIPNNVYGWEAFQNIFRPLTTLYISVLDVDNDRGVSLTAPMCDFWAASIPSILNSTTSLTSLTICSRQPVGVRPALPLASICLPALTRLSLNNFILDAARTDHDILEFIVRHKATLTHLDLAGCWVYGGAAGVYPRPWHAVLQRLEQELPGLCSFTGYSGSLTRNGYAFLEDECQYLIDFEAGAETKHLDDAAFQSLMFVVKSRSQVP